MHENAEIYAKYTHINAHKKFTMCVCACVRTCKYQNNVYFMFSLNDTQIHLLLMK